jgi:hypothetical protein
VTTLSAATDKTGDPRARYEYFLEKDFDTLTCPDVHTSPRWVAQAAIEKVGAYGNRR